MRVQVVGTVLPGAHLQQCVSQHSGCLSRINEVAGPGDVEKGLDSEISFRGKVPSPNGHQLEVLRLRMRSTFISLQDFWCVSSREEVHICFPPRRGSLDPGAGECNRSPRQESLGVSRLREPLSS